MEVAPRYARSPVALNDVQVPATGGINTTNTIALTTAANPALPRFVHRLGRQHRRHAHGAAAW